MKKIYILCLLFVFSLSFGQATDTFTGSGLLTANGWVAHSGAGSGSILISTGSLNYTGLTPIGNKVALVAGNAEDVNLSVGTPLTGVAYYSAVINFPNTTGLTTTGDYSLAMGATTGAALTAIYARLFTKTGTAPNTFNIGVVNTSGTGSTANFVATDFPAGTTVFVVVKYDRATNTANLFINPILNGSEPAATLTNTTGTTAAPTQIASILFRQVGTATAGSGNIEFDDVRIGSTWSYVTGSVLSNKQNQISGLKVFPNPVKDVLNITSDANETKNVVIFDVLGKQVLNVTTDNATINVANINAGVYIVKVTEEGKTATRKLVIQ